MRGLPAQCPDKVAGVGVIEMTFKSPPNQVFSAGCVMTKTKSVNLSGKWFSKPVLTWQVSQVTPKKGDVTNAKHKGPKASLGWQPIRARDDGFVNIHDRHGDADGIVYLANRFSVPQSGAWALHVGHDGGVRAFVDGRAVLTVPQLLNPANPGRSQAEVKLAKGVHEIVIALDTAEGRGWGIYFSWGVPKSARKANSKPMFPEVKA